MNALGSERVWTFEIGGCVGVGRVDLDVRINGKLRCWGEWVEKIGKSNMRENFSLDGCMDMWCHNSASLRSEYAPGTQLQDFNEYDVKMLLQYKYLPG